MVHLFTQKAAITILLIISFISLQAQDLHFSQFYHSTLNVNPALTGLYSGDNRFTGNYRNQWASVPTVDYTTFSGAAEWKVYFEGLRSSYFGVGLIVNNDQAGTSKLSRLNVGATISYSRQLSANLFLTGGGMIGVSQRSFDVGALSFDEQFQDGVYDPSLSRESFTVTNLQNLDVSAGLNIRVQPEGAHPVNKRTKLDMGAALHHIPQPNEAFDLNETARLNMRYSGYLMGTLMLANGFDLLVRGVAQGQGEYRENVFGGGGKIYLSRQEARPIAFVLGSSYRFSTAGDAFIPFVELHVQRWMLGVSYDVNVSDFSTASFRRGGAELAFRYTFTKLRPTQVMKVCPII